MLAPDQWFGYAYRAAVRRHRLDFVGAKADLEHALALAPSESNVQSRYGNILAVFGDLPGAKRALRKAIELDSLNYAPWFNLSLYLMAERDYASARLALGRAYAIQPNAWFMAAALAQLDLIEGKADEALTKYKNSSGSELLRLQGIALAEHTLGDDKQSQAALDQLIALHAGNSAYQIATVYAWRGENDKAFEWLQRAYQGRNSDLDFIWNDPQLSGLRADPRYHGLLVQMKLTQ